MTGDNPKPEPKPTEAQKAPERTDKPKIDPKKVQAAAKAHPKKVKEVGKKAKAKIEKVCKDDGSSLPKTTAELFAQLKNPTTKPVQTKKPKSKIPPKLANVKIKRKPKPPTLPAPPKLNETERKKVEETRKPKTIPANAVYPDILKSKADQNGIERFTNKDGNRIVWDRKRNIMNVFDKTGHQIAHYEKDKTKNVFFDKQGHPLQDYQSERQLTPQISEDEYMARLQKSTPNRQEFFRYEKIFLENSDTGGIRPEAQKRHPKSLLKKIREYGKTIAMVPQLKAEIEKQFGVKIQTEQEENKSVITHPSSVAQLRAQLENLQTELQKFSPTFLKNVDIKKFHLLSDAIIKKGNGRPKDHSLRNDSNYAGVYDNSDKEIGIFSKTPYVIPHEIGHAADDTDGGMKNDNPRWIRCSKKHGGEAAATYLGDKHKDLEERPTHFPSEYGTKSTDEDFAEVVGELMDPESKIQEQAKTEPGLAWKVKETKRFILDVSEGEMDEQYWKDLKTGKIDHDYWQKRRARGDFPENHQKKDDKSCVVS